MPSVDEIQHDLGRPSLKALGITGILEIVSMVDPSAVHLLVSHFPRQAARTKWEPVT